MQCDPKRRDTSECSVLADQPKLGWTSAEDWVLTVDGVALSVGADLKRPFS
jgi:hypothetical protein